MGAAWLARTDGTCEYCRHGKENLCPASLYTGWDIHGGYAEYLTVADAYVHPLPAGFSDAELAPLLCAGIIGYRALLRAEIPPGGTLEIAGIYLTDIPSLNYARHLFQERTLRSVTANTRGDAADFLTLAQRLRIKVTTTPYPFDRADQALADLADGRVRGAAVLSL